jgi:hypothetical protein
MTLVHDDHYLARIHIGGIPFVRVVGCLTPACDWFGPDGRRCTSWLGHGPWKSPSGPHNPDRAMRAVKLTSGVDPMNLALRDGEPK